MKNNHSVLYFFFAAFCIQQPFVTLSQETSKKYNVIFISTHDMTDRISFLGKPGPYAPNFERLAARSMVFYNDYCQYPLSSPGRTSLLSGWRPDKTGVFINGVQPRSLMGNEVKFLPEYFHQYGYRTERYGTAMLHTWESDIEWDYAEPVPPLFTIAPIGSFHTESEIYKGGNWWIDEKPDSITEQALITKHYIARLQQPEPKPFFFSLGYVQTHNPFYPSLENWNKNGDPSVQDHLPDRNGDTTNFIGNGSGNIVLPQTPANDRNDVPPIAFSDGPVIKTDDEWRKTVHAYDGDVSQLDTYLGWVLDEIDRQDLWKNSIVIFWVDHGQHLGEHGGTWLKGTIFEESLRIPLIICVPGKKPGVCYKLTENADVYATLAELCGLPQPAGMEGTSLAPLIDNPSLDWKRAVFSQTKRPGVMGRTIRTEQYRYSDWGTYGEELYDHNTDSFEYTNLANKAGYENVLNEMRTILAEGWENSVPPVYQLLTFFKDYDNDGYGIVSDSVRAYGIQEGYVAIAGDCNDSNATVYPGAAELCDGIDNNCNTKIDDGLPKPKITPGGSTEICETGIVTLSTGRFNGFNYQWKWNNTIIPGATKRLYNAKEPGIYSVSVDNLDGCIRTSGGVTVTDTCNSIIPVKTGSTSGIRENIADVAIFPNPSAGNVTVIYNSIYSENALLEIHDVSGKKLFSEAFVTVIGKNSFRLRLPGLTNGIYYLEVKQKKCIIHKKLVIEK